MNVRLHNWSRGMLAAAALVIAGAEAQAQRFAEPPGRTKVEVYPWVAKSIKDLQKGKDTKERAKAARMLSRANNAKVIPVLAHYAAYDPNLEVREACSAAVHEIRSQHDRWTPPEYPDVDRGRGLVAEKLADERDRVQEAWEAVSQLRSDKKPFRREAAARTLGRIGGPRVLPVLAHAAAYDPDSTVRNVAGRAIDRIREREDGWRTPEAQYQIAEVPYPDVSIPGGGRFQREPEPLDPTAERIRSAVHHYLSRVPRPEEVRDWVNHFRRGGDYMQMLAVFLTAEEYFQRAGADPATMVARLYEDVLRREATDNEIRTWLKRWHDVRDRTRLVHDFLDASQREMQQRGLGY